MVLGFRLEASRGLLVCCKKDKKGLELNLIEKRPNIEAPKIMEQYDMRNFYKTVNGVRRKTTLPSVICNYRKVNLLTDETMVAAR